MRSRELASEDELKKILEFLSQENIKALLEECHMINISLSKAHSTIFWLTSRFDESVVNGESVIHPEKLHTLSTLSDCCKSWHERRNEILSMLWNYYQFTQDYEP